jgi:hypothetical protein
MSIARNVLAVIVALLSITVNVTPAVGATPVSCGPVVSGYLDAGDGWLVVVGTRVTARGWLGFSSFTMQDQFQIETYPLHTSGSVARRLFYAPKSGTSAFTGNVHEVFTDRGNGDEDRSAFWIGRSGAVFLRSITWNGSWRQLQGQVCYLGPEGQLVVTGHLDNSGFGTDFWSFVMQRDTLI